jgi:hypothetical protein
MTTDNTNDSNLDCTYCSELRRRYYPGEGVALARAPAPTGWRGGRGRRRRNDGHSGVGEEVECPECQRSFTLPGELEDLQEALLTALAPLHDFSNAIDNGEAPTMKQAVKWLRAAIRRFRAADVRRLPPAPREWLLGTADFLQKGYLSWIRKIDPEDTAEGLEDSLELDALNHATKLQFQWLDILAGDGEFSLESEDDDGEPVACPECRSTDRISVVRNGRPFVLFSDRINAEIWALECGNCGHRHRFPVVVTVDGHPPEPVNLSSVERQGSEDEGGD